MILNISSLCIPAQLAYKLVHDTHVNVFSLHPGEKKLRSMLEKKFMITGITTIINQVVQNCFVCRYTKTFPKRHLPYGKKIPISAPQQVVSIDICTYDAQQSKKNL